MGVKRIVYGSNGGGSHYVNHPSQGWKGLIMLTQSAGWDFSVWLVEHRWYGSTNSYVSVTQLRDGAMKGKIEANGTNIKMTNTCAAGGVWYLYSFL